jgi:hypothetical protein
MKAWDLREEETNECEENTVCIAIEQSIRRKQNGVQLVKQSFKKYGFLL